MMLRAETVLNKSISHIYACKYVPHICFPVALLTFIIFKKQRFLDRKDSLPFIAYTISFTFF